MDTTASRGGVAPDGSTAGSGRVRVEVEGMPDGRTIRFYAAAPLVSGERRDSDPQRSQGAEPR